jgi:hypothetical protein
MTMRRRGRLASLSDKTDDVSRRVADAGELDELGACAVLVEGQADSRVDNLGLAARRPPKIKPPFSVPRRCKPACGLRSIHPGRLLAADEDTRNAVVIAGRQRGCEIPATRLARGAGRSGVCESTSALRA